MKLQRTQMQLQMVKQNAKAKEVYNEELKKAENHRESGYIFIQQKDYKNALVSFQQATTIYKELREQGKHILTLIDIGRVKCLEKDFPQAKSVYHSARKIAREVNNREAEAQILESLASINEQEGQLLQAKRLYSESLSLYNGVGNQLACGRIYEWFAIQADGSKKFDEAEQLYKSALARYKDADPQAYERTTKALKIVSPWGFLVDLQTPHLHVLRGPKISVGRNSPEEGILNDIDFSNRYISRRHFDIQQDGTLEDLRSRNGTTINGRLLPYGVGAKLKNGDIIALANIKVLQYRTDRPLSVTSVPNGTWAVFIDGIANTYHYLTGPEYSLVFTGEKITLAPGFSNQASMKLRWNNGKAEMLKMSDDWIDQVLYKETDYVYKEYDLPEDKWLELIDVPQRCRKLKLSSKGNDIITEGPAFQVVHYADSVPNDLELAR